MIEDNISFGSTFGPTSELFVPDTIYSGIRQTFFSELFPILQPKNVKLRVNIPDLPKHPTTEFFATGGFDEFLKVMKEIKDEFNPKYFEAFISGLDEKEKELAIKTMDEMRKGIPATFGPLNKIYAAAATIVGNAEKFEASHLHANHYRPRKSN